MATEDQLTENVLFGLTKIINNDLRSLERECAHPSNDPDVMDDNIKFYRIRVAELRELRAKFEDAMSKRSHD